MKKLLFLTYADQQYFPFVATFIYFCSHYNPDCVIEIFLSNREQYENDYQEELLLLKSFGITNFVLTQSLYENKVLPNTVRFIQKPQSSAEYVYITDLDILTLDNVLDKCLDLMESNKIPYVNVVRTGSVCPRLTGLHFCPYNIYYDDHHIDPYNYLISNNIFSASDLAIANDEHVLYKYMESRNLLIREDYSIRPQFGIHVSLNRLPEANSDYLGWGILAYKKEFLHFVKKDSSILFFGKCNHFIRYLIFIIESVCMSKFDQLKYLSARYVMDFYSVPCADGELNRIELMRKQFIESRDFLSAHMCSLFMLNQRISKPRYWFNFWWTLKSLATSEKDLETFVSVFSHVPNSSFFLDSIQKK